MQPIKLNRSLTWVSIAKPGQKDIAELERLVPLHPIIADELSAPSDRSKVERFDDYLFLVYHIPVYRADDRTSRRSEVDLIVTARTVAAITYEPIEPLLQFERDLRGRLQGRMQTSAQVVYYLLEEINDFSARQLKHVEKKVGSVGDQLFRRQDRTLLEEISYIKRDLLDFSIIAAAQRAALETLRDVGSKFWGKDAAVYCADLLGDFHKIVYLLENLTATIESYSETISQLFQFKTSEVIRRFSILGFLTFPLLLYTTIALQPSVAATFIRTPLDFWIIFGIISAVVIAIAVAFRRKGWL